MRRTRPLLLVIILFLVVAVTATYNFRIQLLNKNRPAVSPPLKPGVQSTAEGWHYTKTDNGRPLIEVWAKKFQQIQEPSKFELEGLKLHLFHKNGNGYDQVTSAKADFDINDGILFSEGAVEITLGMIPDTAPSGRLLSIRSSGVRYESKTGKATTDRAASFSFDKGDGKAVGAVYDPGTRELHLKSEVQLTWHGTNPSAKAMTVNTSDVVYKERESKVFLTPWSKLTRDTMTLEAGPAEVTLDHGTIRLIDAVNAHGKDTQPMRELEYAADKLSMTCDDEGQIQKIVGERNAKLVSLSSSSRTETTSDRLDLDFTVQQKESFLDKAVATGHAQVQSAPLSRPGVLLPDTRILRSAVIDLKMQPGGKELASMETQSRGSLEFRPNRPGQPHRHMTGEKMWVTYGPHNQIQSFRSVNVTTRTESGRLNKDGKTPAPPALTSSKELLAEFDPKSAQLSKLQQWNTFQYEEGTRKARADRAVLDQPTNAITLTGSARMWDPSGSAAADRILLNQENRDFTAEGHVTSTRVPEKRKTSSAMLDQDQPLQAKADKMIATDNNMHIRYDGHAITWQGSNRLQANQIEIDRENEILKAHGQVVSEFVDKPKAVEPESTKPGLERASDANKPSPPPIFTVVKAPELVYSDEDRLAHYTGGVHLVRPGMDVKAQEIRAYLKDSEEDSSLDHAFADTRVIIVQTAADRTRTGTSEHAEYYVDEEKILLTTGRPQLIDSVRGTTRGERLTYFANEDRLLVDGAVGQPAVSRIRKTK